MKKITAVLLTALFLTHNSFAESGVSGAATISIPAAETPSSPVLSVPIGNHMEITATTQHQEDAQLSYTIDYSYPQITGENISVSAKKFNSLVLARVTQSIQQFKNYVKADMPHMQTLPDSLKHNSLQMDYTVDVIKPAKEILISVRMSVEGMQAGRAHPYHNHPVVNFNLTTGKELTLKDLFKPRVNYLTLFAKYSSEELNKKLQDKWMIKDGTAPLAKNYGQWNLSHQGIRVTFEEYQVAPYVAGSQIVEIPYSVLKNSIAHNAPIAACVTGPAGCGL